MMHVIRTGIHRHELRLFQQGGWHHRADNWTRTHQTAKDAAQAIYQHLQYLQGRPHACVPGQDTCGKKCIACGGIISNQVLYREYLDTSSRDAARAIRRGQNKARATSPHP